MDHDRLSIRLANHLSEIPRIAKAVETFCGRYGIAASAIFAINVSLEELLGNTMTYGYTDDLCHQIAVEIWRDDADLVIDIADDAKPFDPTRVAPPDLSLSLAERPVGGLGIQLVREMMDQVEYRYHGQRNWVRLRKRVAPG